MRRLRIVVFTGLAVAGALVSLGTVRSTGTPPAALSALRGRGIWGTVGCVTCMGVSLATLTGPIPIGGVLLGGCLSVCQDLF